MLKVSIMQNKKKLKLSHIALLSCHDALLSCADVAVKVVAMGRLQGLAL